MTYFIERDGRDFAVLCFSKPEHAFSPQFGGERLPGAANGGNPHKL